MEKCGVLTVVTEDASPPSGAHARVAIDAVLTGGAVVARAARAFINVYKKWTQFQMIIERMNIVLWTGLRMTLQEISLNKNKSSERDSLVVVFQNETVLRPQAGRLLSMNWDGAIRAGSIHTCTGVFTCLAVDSGPAGCAGARVGVDADFVRTVPAVLTGRAQAFIHICTIPETMSNIQTT